MPLGVLEVMQVVTAIAYYEKRAERILRAERVGGLPMQFSKRYFVHYEPLGVVLVRPRGGSDAALLDAVRPRFAPAQVLVRQEEGSPPATPLAQDRPAQGGKATAYVCVRGACKLPVTDPSELQKLL